mmetsp:Transcript_56173/g.180297  ORF Transcript_56173/g.180297 Transcript_56173/m.180297 type:complete len:219 (-) Transcript_56173:1844-2500(-)
MLGKRGGSASDSDTGMSPPVLTLSGSGACGASGRRRREASPLATLSGMNRTLSALPTLPKGTMSALNLAARRTKSVLFGQKSRYLSPGPWHASRAPPGKRSTGSPRAISLKKFRGVTGTAPHLAKPPPRPKFSPTPTLWLPSLLVPSSRLELGSSMVPCCGLAPSWSSNSAWAPSREARTTERSSKGSPTKSRSSGWASRTSAALATNSAKVSGKLMG